MSAWIAHVKKYAKEHGIKYGAALSEAGKTFTKAPKTAASNALPDFSKFRKKRRSKKRSRTARKSPSSSRRRRTRSRT